MTKQDKKQEIMQGIDKVLQSKDPYALKLSTISQSLDDYLAYGLKECLPKEVNYHQDWNEVMIASADAHNIARQQIISTAKEKFNIEL